jgi:hypothetical protein
MDPQTIQALMGVFQQGLQILQQAQGGGSAPGAAPMGGPPMAGAAPMGAGGPPGGPMMDEDDMDDDDDYADDDGNEGDETDMDDDGMGGGQSLHDRVSQLEGHTGLKKSASGSLSERLDALESELLGLEYEGPLVERVMQLEKAAGINYPSNDAPDEIPLDALIKSAIQAGISRGMAELAGSSDELPNPAKLRKGAKDQRYGQRRGRSPQPQSDAELAKTAAQMGWDEGDLDEPVSLGDALLMQYHAQQSGEALPFPDDDDD